MGERRTLVIGSQCKAPQPPFSFLSGIAQHLFEVMTDPARGACVPALDAGGLLCDRPTVTATKQAIAKAIQGASEDEATLFLALIGHGVFAGDDFYYLPFNASPQPTSDTAVHLIQLLKGALRSSRNVDGLVVLLDTCYSGLASQNAGQALVREFGGLLRLEVVAASEADRTAADACFSRNLVDLVQNGLASVSGGTLLGQNLVPELAHRCPDQQPQ